MRGIIMSWRRGICNTLNLTIAGSNLCGTCKAGGTHVNVRRPYHLRPSGTYTSEDP
jgi:predicted RNA-binding protein with PUA domain